MAMRKSNPACEAGHFLEVGGAVGGGGMEVDAAYVFVKGGQGGLL